MKRWFKWLPLGAMAAGWLAPGLHGQAEPAALELGKTLERQITGGETHAFRFTLERDQFAHIRINQLSIDLFFKLEGPDGKQLRVDNVNPIGGWEEADLVADAGGDYRLQLSPADPKAPAGKYEITLTQRQAATAQHRKRVEASLQMSQANTIWSAHTRAALAEAGPKLERVAALWHEAGDAVQEASTLFNLGLLYIEYGDQTKALEYSERAMPVAKAAGDPRMEGFTLYTIAQVYNHFGDRRKAVEYGDRALPLFESSADRAGEGDVLNLLGTAYVQTGEQRKGLEYFARAEKLFAGVQDRRRLATLRGNMGLTYSELGEYDHALEIQLQVLAERRETGDRVSEAITLNNIASQYASLAEYQKALDSLNASLEINRSLNRPPDIAINLHNIGFIYDNLGDPRRARESYEEALEIVRGENNRAALGNTLNNLAEVYNQLGDYRKALELHLEGLSYRRAASDRDGEATTLSNIAKTYMKLGDPEKARENHELALSILRSTGNRRNLAMTLRSYGTMFQQTGDYAAAEERLNESLEISRATRERRTVADTLVALARVESARGDALKAHQRASEALDIFEAVRLGVASSNLRASYFAKSKETQELDISALMRLDRERPGEGFGSAALLAAERGRARSLLELLGESGAQIREGVDGKLLDRERELHRLISGKADQQTRLLNRKHTDAEAAAAGKELDALAAELEQVQGRIRTASPRFAALTQPAPLDLKEIQKTVADQDTVLLEYSLGAERSFLWAVTPSSMDAFELPKRSEIEAAAKRVYDLLTARNQRPEKETSTARAIRLRQADDEYAAAAAKASQMLLGPVAAKINGKRLLIVGEGVLSYLPFGALPEPSGRTTPLIVNHEVVMAPSASVVAVLRQETAGRKPAEKTLAVLADPVFTADDARIAQQRSAVKPVDGGQEFVRLRFSRTEADEIAKLAPASATLKALDFDATRELALKPELGRYRIVHFATHSVLNNDRPELSGVVLSLVDRSGKTQNGFLRLYDIYNLRLGSDLVVLSACQTALGGEIKGEGLIGLTRGFLYAGAPRVVASLWEIDDRSTADLMKRFYEGMLAHGERPAAALRNAQIAMWRTRGSEPPYYWAAFTLQGEWR